MRARNLFVAIALSAAWPARRIVAQHAAADSANLALASASARTVVVVRANNASIHVAGARGNELRATLRDAADRPRPSWVGALRIATAGDSVLVEVARALTAPAVVDVTVPIGVSLRIVGDNGGAIRVSGVGGPVEITSSNGAVAIAGATGFAIVATSNGGIVADLSRVAPDAMMSFITSNGDVELTLPKDVDATLSVDASLEVKSEVPLTRVGGGSPRLVALNLGRGGPPIRIATDNGVVRIHVARATAPR